MKRSVMIDFRISDDALPVTALRYRVTIAKTPLIRGFLQWSFSVVTTPHNSGHVQPLLWDETNAPFMAERVCVIDALNELLIRGVLSKGGLPLVFIPPFD